MSGHLRTCNFELINFHLLFGLNSIFQEKKQSDWWKYRLPLEMYKCFSKSMSGHLKNRTQSDAFQSKF